MQIIRSRWHRRFLSPGLCLFLILISFFTACSPPTRTTTLPPSPTAADSSTIGDLSRWDEAIFYRTFASPAVLHDMFTQQVSWGCGGTRTTQLCHGGPFGYGYGWFIFFNDNGIQRPFIDHTGEMNGFVTDNLYYPEQKLTIIILSNLGTFNRYTIEDRVEQLLLPDHSGLF